MDRIIRIQTILSWLLVTIIPVFVFGVFLAMAGASPIETYLEMMRNALGGFQGLGEVIVRAAPIVLCALATIIPAKAGMINVGAEGQLAVGALTATVAAVVIGDGVSPIFALVLAALAGALGGLLWAGLAGALKVLFRLNETISTLLLNYVAALFVRYIIHGPLRDPASFNWPFSPPLAESFRFPVLSGGRVHLGVAAVPLIAMGVWYLLHYTAWGFRLRVTGGNLSSAVRAGFQVNRILLFAMLAGGALAGLGGMMEVCGMEGRLRPTTGTGLGYIGFLAAWMAGQHSLWSMLSSALLALMVVSGDTLQIFAGMPASSINILMALVLMGVLARRGRKKDVD